MSTAQAVVRMKGVINYGTEWSLAQREHSVLAGITENDHATLLNSSPLCG